jgi:hypothetical protein
MKRTLADGKTKKQIANDKKQAKKDQYKANVHKVAKIEKRITADEKVANITPKSRGTSSCKLQRTRSYAQIPLTKETTSGSDNAGSDDSGEGTPQDETEANTTDHTETEAITTNHKTEADSTDQEAPPKKKTKRGFCDDVQRYLDNGSKKSRSACPDANSQCADDVEITENGIGDSHKVVVSRQCRFDMR